LLIERLPRRADITALAQITPRQALSIGFAQLTALIPGVSRSGASILGGLLLGLDRPTATQFSFYLAIPTLGLATLYQLFSALREGAVEAVHLPLFLLGAAIAFVVALASIAWLLRYVAGNSFRLFGIYRILVGALILFLVIFTTVLN
jgi:undecaprenyl-diphosphatase